MAMALPSGNGQVPDSTWDPQRFCAKAGGFKAAAEYLYL